MLTRKSHIYAGLMLVAFSFVFSACSLSTNQSEPTQEIAEERPGVTIKGKLVQAAGKYFLQSGGKDTEVTSRRIDLMQWVGKEVEVHGEYSGTTLYLDSIK